MSKNDEEIRHARRACGAGQVMTPTQRHHDLIEVLRSLAREGGSRDLVEALEDLFFYLDHLERQGINDPTHNVVKRPELTYHAPEDLRLCLEEERALARSFLAFVKVAIDVAKKQAERKGRSVEEWAAILAATARST